MERLSGTDSLRPQTLRSPSRLLAWDTTARSGAPFAPELLVSSNTDLAEGGNDGAMWQGRGRNLMLTAGYVAQYGPFRLVLAPQLVASQNLDYQVIPYQQDRVPRRSIWANPFHPAPEGLDLPLRHGDDRILRLTPGQSSLTLRQRGVEVGLSTENVWWGPGMRNAILLSSNAPGIPAAFVRTSSPVATRTGTWDAWLMVGMLAESSFFDSDSANDDRTLAGLALTWRPPGSEAVEIGAGRVVIASQAPSFSSILAPLRSVGRPNGPDSLDAGDRDQVTSLWARLAPPGSGFETWAEWARFEEPASFRDLLEAPGHSQGYTLGLQWLRPVRQSRVRLWAEATYLEPSPSVRTRPVGTSYVSRAVAQGFTHGGQALGAAIGPGASGQGVGADLLQNRWRIGAYATRVRWDNAALFTSTVPGDKREDVSLTGGLRAAGQWGPVRVTGDWAHTARVNYLYQAFLLDPATGRTEGIDIVNDLVTLTISAPLR